MSNEQTYNATFIVQSVPTDADIECSPLSANQKSIIAYERLDKNKCMKSPRQVWVATRSKLMTQGPCMEVVFHTEATE
jgi:hypothetical protein